MPTDPPDTAAELLEARLAYGAARHELDKLEPRDRARPAAQAALNRAHARYVRAVRAHEEQARRDREG
jgi:hypothetical protein